LKYLFDDDEYNTGYIDTDKYMVQVHVFIEREHNNKCTHYGSKLEACTSVVNQDQAFEAGFSNEG
jgi:hypothetical protein